ncbi:MAG: class I SAM-dependent DNA methyltransferase [Candidatus Brocadiales bacterium]|nr:class I SAM-dependent DNA methyltransferase [Candidatus Brocadiales bacterium]
MTPQEFVNKWRDAELKESSFSQEHFIDLCHLVGHQTPAAFDPKGEKFTFEAGAGRGFADVWKAGFFAWEYKGDRKDLDGAYDQLLRYRESLQNPPLLIVADTGLIRIHTNFTNTVKREYEIVLDDLLDPEKLEILKCAFFEPQRLKADETPEQVTEQAAKDFARLAEILRKWGEDPSETAHFLIRLLFCLFSEDIGLLPRDLFTRLVARTKRNAAAFAGQLCQLFSAMSTGGWFGEHEIINFDGGLFDSDFALELDSEGIDILAAISGLDWSSIEPSILGTLFERSLDPNKRAQLGAHYTSREDILLIVEPVLMAPLRRRWEDVEAEARKLADIRNQADTARKRQNRNSDIQRLLEEYAAEIRSVRVLDPACGSGNFLYVALRQLLELWREVSNLAGELGLPLLLPTSAPSPEQLFGIELNAYAHELAQATIWIGFIQWLRENGFGQPPEPILKKLDNIKQMDAILTSDESGSPIEPDWPKADVVIGNPPFLGDKKMRGELGDKYVEDLRSLYQDRVPGGADLVTYWFERSRAYIQVGKLLRAGLLATNSIRGGSNRVVLDRITETGSIFWAISDKEWILEGAAVNISMVGFDSGKLVKKYLDNQKVEIINSNLTSTVDITKAKRLEENFGIAYIGDSKKAKFEISNEIAQEMLSKPINPNNRPNSDVIIPWLNGIDVTRRPQNMWIIDFGIDMKEEEASLYEIPYEHIRIHVKPQKDKVRSQMEKSRWWLHARPAPDMRKAIKRVERFIATSNVSKHRLFVWFLSNYLPSHSLTVFARDDDYFFGVLHSKIHGIWALRQGTSLEDRPRYTPTTTFETFPFPWSPGKERQDSPRVMAISEAARELNEKRERWLNPEEISDKELKKRTLTNLYNERPTWLDLAHHKLDQAVLDAYGWLHDISNEKILENLLELNLERAENE